MRRFNTVTLLFLFFFFLCSFTAVGEKKEGLVSGKVLTKDNLSAEAITVYLKDTKYYALTDQNGNFHFSVPEGHYTLIYYSIFAHKKEIEISVRGGENNTVPDMVLVEKQEMLEEVVVTGQFRPQSLNSSVNKIRVINNMEIQKRAATDVFAILRLEPGMRISNDHQTHESDVEMMGMRGSSVKILLNGMPLKDNGGKKQTLSQIDVNTIEKIEIVEGPMSIVYGTDALAGVINIITKKGSRKPSVNLSILEETVGSNYFPFCGEGMHNEHISSNWAHKSGAYVQGSFSRIDNGGWKGNKEGRERQWAPKKQYVTAAEVGINREQFTANYSLVYVNEAISVPIVMNASFPNEVRDGKFLVNRFNHTLRTVYSANNSLKIEFDGSLQKYGRKSYVEVFDKETKKTKNEAGAGGGYDDDSSFEYWFSKLAATWTLSPKIGILSGIDFERESVSGNKVKNQKVISNFSLFALLDWKVLDNLHLTGGLRKNLYSDFESPVVIPSIQAKLSITKFSDLRLSYSNGYRAPKARELYYHFHDASHNLDGNPDLKPEYSQSFKSSYTWRALHSDDLRLTTSLNAFVNNYTNFIELIPDINDASHYIQTNIHGYSNIGSSVDAQLSFAKWNASGSFMLMGLKTKKDEKKNMNQIKYSYSPEINLMLSYEPIKKATISLFYKYTGKMERYGFDAQTNKYELGTIDAYNWFDLTASYGLGKKCILKGGIKNIFNINTVNDTRPRSNPHEGEPGASSLAYGRSFFLGVNYNLN